MAGAPATFKTVTVRLTVRTAMWRSHIAQVANSVDGLIPVVKGNGYGFGRLELARLATEFSDTVAVGTVLELYNLPKELTAVVLTPTLTPPETAEPILTIGNTEHIQALSGWAGRVTVKLSSAMQRYGRGPELVELARDAGLEVVSASIHPPLAGTSDAHLRDILAGIERLSDHNDLPIWLSHLDADTYALLPTTRSYRLRLGTALWHGDKRALHLTADVLDVRDATAGSVAGYRLTPVESDGDLVMIGAGTANGVTALADDRSPFHFERTRLVLHEAPHMHTSMAFVPAGRPLPAIGDRVDLQRPLHMTAVDEFEWL
jgi:alanine racemase